MNESLGHTVLSSLKEYINYRLLKDAAAYTNRSATLYNYTDKRFPTKYIYGSPYASWVYNSGVYGPTVASGIYNPTFTPKSTGLFVDYRNGRIISNSALTGTLTAQVAVPDINTYVTTYSDYKLIAETKYLTLPSYKGATGYLPPDSHVLSALFFRMSQTKNQELGFGGLDWSVYNIKVTAAMANNYHLTAVADILRDSQNRIFPLLTQTPLNEHNDLKAGWDYAAALANPNSYAFINNSNFSHFENDTVAQNNPQLEVGLGNIEVRVARNPRQLFP